MTSTLQKLLAGGLTLAALGAMWGCNRRAGAADREASSDGAADSLMAANSSPPTEWTDARILGAVVAANTADSTLGALAVRTSQSQRVKDFAQSMVRDHGQGNSMAQTAAGKANLTVEKAPGDPAAEEMNGLRTLKGAEFDQRYVQNEVSFHDGVLQAIDNQLLPNARHAEVRSYLEQIRPIVAAHLDRAKILRVTVDRGVTP